MKKTLYLKFILAYFIFGVFSFIIVTTFVPSMTREQLLDQIWGYEYVGDTRTVDVHIKRLREKIKDHANWKITTIWGVGYKFEVRNP